MYGIEEKRLYTCLDAHCTEKYAKSNINRSRTIEIDARKYIASRTYALNG